MMPKGVLLSWRDLNVSFSFASCHSVCRFKSCWPIDGFENNFTLEANVHTLVVKKANLMNTSELKSLVSKSYRQFAPNVILRCLLWCSFDKSSQHPKSTLRQQPSCTSAKESGTLPKVLRGCLSSPLCWGHERFSEGETGGGGRGRGDGGGGLSAIVSVVEGTIRNYWFQANPRDTLIPW